MIEHFIKNFARGALFIVYAWFGVLKLFDASPANPLVSSLLERTLPFISFGQFIVLLGIFEVIIGVLFLLPRYRRLTSLLFGLHMVMTTAPLIVLPAVAWQGWFVPSLEGQYMLKNIVLIALALTVLTPPSRQ